MAKRSVCVQYQCNFFLCLVFPIHRLESADSKGTDTESQLYSLFLPSFARYDVKPIHIIVYIEVLFLLQDTIPLYECTNLFI